MKIGYPTFVDIISRMPGARPMRPLAYRSQVVGNAAVLGQSALNYDERLLTHSPNSPYVLSTD